MPQPCHTDNDLRGVSRLRSAFIRMHIHPPELIAREPTPDRFAFTYFRLGSVYPFTQKAALEAPPIISRPSEYYIL